MRRRLRLAAALLLSSLLAAACDSGKPTYGEGLARAVREGRGLDARGDMQTIATAITAYVTAGNSLPEAVDINDLAASLEPTYVRVMARRDPWGSAYHYETDGNSYTLSCAGKDKRMGTPDDIIIEDGQLTQMPKGYTTFNGQ